MSLNRHEQAVFDYWLNQPDERRHWQGKVGECTRNGTSEADSVRVLERELWDYLVERSQHVPGLHEYRPDGPRRLSMQNLAEHIIRLWGPPTKPKKPGVAAG